MGVFLSLCSVSNFFSLYFETKYKIKLGQKLKAIKKRLKIKEKKDNKQNERKKKKSKSRKKKGSLLIRKPRFLLFFKKTFRRKSTFY